MAQRFVRLFRPGRIFPVLVGTMVALVFLFAALMRVFDRTDFPTYGRALWWAVSTITTVGYGDVVPEQPVGRVVAAVLMIAGFAFLSLLTGMIASALVTRRVSGEQKILRSVERIERRLDELERRGTE
jgi:voltage-gated potassium channel